MKLHVPFLTTLLVVGLVAGHVKADDAKVAPPKGQRVFTAGHSFHMPIVGPLAEIAKSAGIDHVTAGTQSIGGSTVTQHWDLQNDKNKAKKALITGNVDVLTLSPHFVIPDPAIDKFVALLLEHNLNGRVMLQASWIPRDGALFGAFNPATRDTAKIDYLRASAAPYNEKIRAQAKALNDRYADKLKRPVVFVVPVGEAVTLLRERLSKGEVPGITRQSELFRDALGHGKEHIYLLNAYCHFAVIYGKSPVGLPSPKVFQKAGLGENTEKVNRILQEIAWQAVTTEPMSGVTQKRAD